MSLINSFDIFDTIVGRLCYLGINIFEIIETNLNIPNFKNIRHQCEYKTKGIDNIYANIQKYYNNFENISVDWEKVKQLELELEFELSFPINKYFQMIMPNDILVSDMYLEEFDIRKIINKHYLINNDIYVEPSHKSDCTFWKNNPIVSKINTHWGDNKISDYKNPLKYNIKAELIDNVPMNNLEQRLEQTNKYLSYLIRACRLTNQNGNFMNKIFNEISLPLCIQICLYLNIICVQNMIEHIIFISRDGYWFKYMYNILYPDVKTTYHYLSMRMVKEENFGSSLETLRNIPGKKIIFDLFGTGNTLKKLLDLININTDLKNKTIGFMTFNHHKSDLATVQNLAYRYMQYINYVESLFPAPHGSALGYDENGEIIFKEIEYDVLLLKDYMIGMKTFEKYYNTLNKYVNIIQHTQYNYDLLRKNMFYIMNIGAHSFIKNISYYIDDHRVPEKNYDYYFENLNIRILIQNYVKYECNQIFINFANYKSKDIEYLKNYLNWSECDDFKRIKKIKLAIINTSYKNFLDLIEKNIIIEYVYLIDSESSDLIETYEKINNCLFKKK